MSIISDTIANQQINGAIINVSGRQRMLSQKIARLSNQIVVCTEIGVCKNHESITKELDYTIHLMSQSHIALISGDIDEIKKIAYISIGNKSEYFNKTKLLSEQTKKLYFETPNLNMQVVKFLTDARKIFKFHQEEYDKGRGQVIDEVLLANLTLGLHQITEQYGIESELETKNTILLESIVLCFVLLFLAFEAIFLFFPMIRNIKLDHEKLKFSKDEIEKVLELRLKKNNINLDLNSSINLVNKKVIPHSCHPRAGGDLLVSG